MRYFSIFIVIVSLAFVGGNEAYSEAAENPYIIEPTGLDDSTLFNGAFSIVTAPGSPYTGIKLKGGPFNISETILVNDFNGTFEGDGKTASIINYNSYEARIGFMPGTGSYALVNSVTVDCTE